MDRATHLGLESLFSIAARQTGQPQGQKVIFVALFF
jgi:hypothetical protein